MQSSYLAFGAFAALSLLSVKVPDGVSPATFYGISALVAVSVILLALGCIRLVWLRVVASFLVGVALVVEFGSIIVNGSSYFGLV